jgi:hypothetical protein
VSYQVNITDKMRNYQLKDDEGFLFCLFEAISNSLWSCMNNKKIDIEITIKREYEINSINTKHKDNFIKNLTITDNGIGFTNENFNNFARKIEASDHGGKGLGRLSYLKVFNLINVESFFRENNKIYKRVFEFNKDNLPIEVTQESKGEQKTTLFFDRVNENYKQKTKKDIEFYYDEIIKHFYIFLYFLNDKKKSFSIKINDDAGKITTKEINNRLIKKDTIEKSSFELKELNTSHFFEITHIKTTNIADNNSFYVVDMRSVGNNILQLPPTTLRDKRNNTFNYYVYLKSDFFNRYLNPSRTELTLPTREEPNCICEKQIIEKLQEEVNLYLKYEISQLNIDKEKKVLEILREPKNNSVGA